MAAYILRRVLLMIPTLLGIMAVSFAVIQFAPGGPVEQVIARITGQAGGDALSGGGAEAGGAQFEAGSDSYKYRGSQGLDPEFIKKLEKFSSASTSRRSSASSR
jgi:microcin C transport system permease protein